MKIIYCDSLVIGGGLAGLRAAAATAAKGNSTIVLSLCPVKRSHSAAAQGGMQASLANSKMSEGDNEDVHFEDTVKGSDWGCDQQVARMFTQTAPKAILWQPERYKNGLTAVRALARYMVTATVMSSKTIKWAAAVSVSAILARNIWTVKNKNILRATY